MGTIPLKTINTTEDIFNDILATMASRIITVSDLSLYYCGYQNKKRILYNGKDTLIIQEYLFAEFANLPLDAAVSSWKQVVVRMSKTSSVWEDSVTGPRAYHYIMKVIGKKYSDSEIKAILNSYTDIKTEEDKQVHIDVAVADYIQLYPNCYKYDINGAHQDALVEMFPKAKNELVDIYNKRKVKPIYKQYMNFAVGQLKKYGYEGAYWWIVHRTSKLLKTAISACCPDDNLDCQIIYANTDGFIVSNPSKTLEHSTELGLFKEEYKGPVYAYSHRGSKEETSYNVYQFGNETKGNVRLKVRDKIDLKNGITVSYKLRKDAQIDFDGNIIRPEIVTNEKIITKEIKICE